MAPFEIVERYASELSRQGSLLDRIFFPWAVRVVATAETVEEATQLRDRLERNRPDVAPLGIWDAGTATTDKSGVTHREWIDYPWRGGLLAKLRRRRR